MVKNISMNQVAPVAMKGALDLQMQHSDVISGIVSANQATALVPGQLVKLDTAAQVFVSSFVAASTSDVNTFIVIYTKKNRQTLTMGMPIEVVKFTGPAIWVEAAAAFAAGASLEYASATNITVQTLSGGKKCGVALDGAAAAGDLCRMLVLAGSVSA